MVKLKCQATNPPKPERSYKNMIPQKQLSLADIYSECKTFFESDKPKFLSLLETNINLNEFIPISFYNHYYSYTGRPANIL